MELLNYVLFFLGFYLLIKGADFLIEGSVSIARKLKVSDLIIGLTIVAFGTSSPELAVNVMASFRDQGTLAISNVLGSNIANILLILGISSMIRNIIVKENTVWKEIPFTFLGSIIVLIIANDIFFNNYSKNEISKNDSLILLCFFIIYMYYIFSIAKKEDFNEEIPKKQLSLSLSIFYIILGLILLTLSSDWIVNGAVQIAKLFHLSEAFIGLTIVAIGTSLPELATSTVASFKQNSDIAIGNVVGSSIFNILFILAISGLIHPLSFNFENNIDAIITVFASLLLFIFLFIGKKHELERNQGILFLIFYIIYIFFRAYLGVK